jgi:hypothetical protein
MSPTTILLYGTTGSGKSASIGKLAEEVYITTGKLTRVCTADFGGTDVMSPYIDLGMVQVESLGTSNPWIWLNRVVRGYTRGPDAKKPWVLDQKANEQVGLFAFESSHSIAQLLKMNMEQEAGNGVNIGGDVNTSFQVAGDGESFKVGTTKGYQKFALPQMEVIKAMYESFKLPAQYVIWTAGVSKDEDDITVSKIVGPDVIGKALTGTLPKDFNYCFRIAAIPAQNGKPERHILYVAPHVDQQAGNATALGNSRRPLDADELKSVEIEPADLVRALKMVREQAKEQAKQKILARLKAAQKQAPVNG